MKAQHSWQEKDGGHTIKFGKIHYLKEWQSEYKQSRAKKNQAEKVHKRSPTNSKLKFYPWSPTSSLIKRKHIC